MPLGQHANVATPSDILLAVRKRLAQTTGIHPAYIYVGISRQQGAFDTSLHVLHLVVEQQEYLDSNIYGGPFINIAILRGHVLVRSKVVLDPPGHNVYRLSGAGEHLKYVDLVSTHLNMFWPYKEFGSFAGVDKVPITLSPMRVIDVIGPTAPDKGDTSYSDSYVRWETLYLPKLPPTAVITDPAIEGYPVGAANIGTTIIEWNLV